MSGGVGGALGLPEENYLKGSNRSGSKKGWALSNLKHAGPQDNEFFVGRYSWALVWGIDQRTFFPGTGFGKRSTNSNPNSNTNNSTTMRKGSHHSVAKSSPTSGKHCQKEYAVSPRCEGSSESIGEELDAIDAAFYKILCREEVHKSEHPGGGGGGATREGQKLGSPLISPSSERSSGSGSSGGDVGGGSSGGTMRKSSRLGGNALPKNMADILPATYYLFKGQDAVPEAFAEGQGAFDEVSEEGGSDCEGDTDHNSDSNANSNSQSSSGRSGGSSTTDSNSKSNTINSSSSGNCNSNGVASVDGNRSDEGDANGLRGGNLGVAKGDAAKEDARGKGSPEELAIRDSPGEKQCSSKGSDGSKTPAKKSPSGFSEATTTPLSANKSSPHGKRTPYAKKLRKTWVNSHADASFVRALAVAADDSGTLREGEEEEGNVGREKVRRKKL